jgi:hypothetical protein
VIPNVVFLFVWWVGSQEIPESILVIAVTAVGFLRPARRLTKKSRSFFLYATSQAEVDTLLLV